MQVITIGRRLVPAAQIAFIEAFDPAANPEFQPDKVFKGRVVLLNRDAVLTEMTPQEFAGAHDLRLFAEDNVAINSSIAFRVEIFTPTERFKPSKPYRTRLKWYDRDGNEQSRLLVTEPEAVITELSVGKDDIAPDSKRSPKRPRRAAKRLRKLESTWS